jgi:hypothetical protein
MRGGSIWVGVLAAAAVALAACGANSLTAASASSPSSASSPALSRVLVVADPTVSSGSGGTPSIVRFFSLDGHEASHASLPTGSQIVGVGGARVFVLDANGKLRALHRGGTYEDLADLGNGSVSFVASPDGKRWVWATSMFQGQTITSAVHLGGDRLTPKTVETVTEDNHSLRPYEWTSVGLFVQHGAVGIGGYIPYLAATGPVDRLDVNAGTATPITGSDTCNFSDMAADGTVACFPNRAQHHVRIISPDGKVTDIPLSTPRFNLTGDAYFSHDGQQITVGGAVGAGFQGGEHYGTDLIKASDGSIARLTLDGVRPAGFMRAACWLADGSLIVYRPSNSADGPGTFVYGADGKSTSITKSGEPLGILTG